MATAQIEGLGPYRPLLVDNDGRLWASRNYILYCSRNLGQSFDKVVSFSPGIVQRAASSVALGSRLLRCGFHGLRKLPSGDLIVVVKGGILMLEKGTDSFLAVHEFDRGSRPLNLCATPAGDLFYGEYWGNPHREEVRIYGSFDGGRNWNVVHTFPRFSVRHVHGIHYDRFRDGLWVLTGDSDKESNILFADSRLRNIEVVVQGNQRCRAVTVIPTESGIVVPTDTEHEQNFIQWLDPETGALEPLVDIPGTVFYSTVTRTAMLISTVVEPSSVNLGREATIWASSDGQDWAKVYSQKKDAWSPVLFQYGTFVLPPADGLVEFAFASGQAVCSDDQQLLRIGV